MDENPGHGLSDFEKSLKLAESLTVKERENISFQLLKNAEDEHNRFREKFSKGLCYLCGSPLKKFHEDAPCLHWLLKPKSIKKKQFLKLFSDPPKFGYVQTNSYLRWVANFEIPISNINDLESNDNSKRFEETIKFKDLEWSFSCSRSDFAGHPGTQKGALPHYHMQMKAHGFPFFRYNDYHIAFTEGDLSFFELKSEHPEMVCTPFSEGMKYLSDWISADGSHFAQLVEASTPCEDRDKAFMNVGTLVQAAEGSSIPVDDLNKILKRAKDKGSSVTEELHKANELSDTRISTFVEPGGAVPVLAPRTKRKKKST